MTDGLSQMKNARAKATPRHQPKAHTTVEPSDTTEQSEPAAQESPSTKRTSERTQTAAVIIGRSRTTIRFEKRLIRDLMELKLQITDDQVDRNNFRDDVINIAVSELLSRHDLPEIIEMVRKR